MSNPDLARRAKAQVFFDGVDISDDVAARLISLSYTDNESEQTDDLQIKLIDRDDVVLTQWLAKMVDAAAETDNAANSYKVTASIGLNVRSGPGKSYSKLGALVYGSIIQVESIENGWATITYSGKTAYIYADYIEAVTETIDGGTDWSVGDAVIVSGRAQYTSYGEGAPGKTVTDMHGTITRLNLKSGVPYPIHVDALGWFSVAQAKKAGSTKNEVERDKDSVKGLRIQAVIVCENWNSDGKDSVLDSGEHELDSVAVSGPPNTVTIKGTSLPYRTTVRQTKKCKAWEGYSLSGIAAEISGINGMSCMYEAEYDPYFERVEQLQESDIAFLQRLCNAAGISLKASSNILVLFDQESYEAKDTVLTITKGDGSYESYKLRTGETDATYDACSVSYTDPSTGAVIEYTYVPDGGELDEESQILKLTQKLNSVTDAQMIAKKMLRLKNKYEYSAEFTLPGNPLLVAGVTVQLVSWGMFDGKYIISQAKHSLSGDGYTISISLRRVLEGY